MAHSDRRTCQKILPIRLTDGYMELRTLSPAVVLMAEHALAFRAQLRIEMPHAMRDIRNIGDETVAKTFGIRPACTCLFRTAESKSLCRADKKDGSKQNFGHQRSEFDEKEVMVDQSHGYTIQIDRPFSA
ncbi:hypothetical protein [Beijerinckia mobilis]|uniref:hypothetical protein n=1 Tax=Beijerinckia mobilis TaxID=231434 RepID=UPI0012EC0BE6|nr:hypothetical protein [Beijerinckia mobilis]